MTITEIALTKPEEVNALVKQANEIVIRDANDFQEAGNLVVIFKNIKKAAHEEKDDNIEKACALHRGLVAELKQILVTADNAIYAITEKRAAYRRMEEEARRKEEMRLEQEAKQKAEEMALLDAIHAAEQGHTELADKIIETPVSIAPIILPTGAPKTKGLKLRRYPRFRITNPDLIQREYMMPDEKKILKQVIALKENCGIAGIEVFWVETE